jgi:two-component system OmpR family response regulator
MAQHPRILVVDDDIPARDDDVRALRRAGYDVATCTTAAEVEQTAATFRPDLAVLEMVLGGVVVGPDLAQRITAQGDPLLFFVTSANGDQHRLAAFEAGADDYVVKPILREELLARVHALLRRGDRLTSVVLEVGGLVIDEGAHRVSYAGREIELSPLDFSLLAVLARHAGQVLSKARLLEIVWGYDTVDESLVEVRISIMRRRLGPTRHGSCTPCGGSATSCARVIPTELNALQAAHAARCLWVAGTAASTDGGAA